MSPLSSLGTRSWSVASTTPAGTISQMARGLLSFLTNSSRESLPVAPSPESCLTESALRSIHDALMAVFLEPAHHVGAHPAEPDHAKLHLASSAMIDLKFFGNSLPNNLSDGLLHGSWSRLPGPAASRLCRDARATRGGRVRQGRRNRREPARPLRCQKYISGPGPEGRRRRRR